MWAQALCTLPRMHRVVQVDGTTMSPATCGRALRPLIRMAHTTARMVQATLTTVRCASSTRVRKTDGTGTTGEGGARPRTTDSNFLVPALTKKLEEC